MKKALLFDPYLDTLGGGERYFLTFAEVLSSLGYRVEVAWGSSAEIDKARDRFGLKLDNITLNSQALSLFTKGGSLLEKLILTSKYDLIFYVSDGSLPFLFSKNNLVHFQVPFKKIGGNSLINQLKLLLIHKLVYNSKFTQNVIEKSLPKSKGFVLYPPIDTESFVSGKKENLIIGVGRFASPSHNKHQDILIEAFREFYKTHPDFHMVLAGGGSNDSPEVTNLVNMAKGFPVEIRVNPNFTELKELYGKAKFFWHAAGFGVDEEKDPEKVEHFGMTTVEAMSAGCIPIVIAKGGQKEILTVNTGFLCADVRDIVSYTSEIVDDTQLLVNFSKNVISRSLNFSLIQFSRAMKTIV